MILQFIAVAFGPRWINQAVGMSFGEPLFEHPLPEDAILISKDAAKDDEGTITAAMLLQTDLTSEELEAFYADLECPPAKKGQTVSIQAKALTEEDLQVLKQAKLYEEGACYQFVYVYSK